MRSSLPRTVMRWLLLLILLAGCSRPPVDPGPCPDAPCGLFDDLGAWTVTGIAADVITGLPEAKERIELEQDFESRANWRFSGGPGGAVLGEAGQKHLVLATQQKARPVWRSRLFEVDPGREYTLSWRMALDQVLHPKKNPKVPAGLTVEFFEVPKGTKRPATWLDNRKNFDKAVKQLGAAVRWRPAEGTAPWRQEEHSFRAPSRVTHMRIVGSGGPWAARKPASRIEIDDLALKSRPTPAWIGLGSDFWQDPGAHPLEWRARGAHPAHKKADEIRDAVLAPAPTTLTRSFRVPQKSRLELGYGLTNGGGTGAVQFQAVVVDDRGKRHVVLDSAAKGRRLVRWRDASVDLDQWEGEQITLELSTKGRPHSRGVQAATARQPEARALWAGARLEPKSKSGRLAVLVVIDTLGARHASGWGAERETTPNLQRIGAEGVFYEQGRSPAAWTFPSVASYMTGLTPDEHGAGQQLGRDHWSRRPLLTDQVTVAERLHEAGWATRAWINNTYMTSKLTRFDQGFERYVDYGTRTRRGGSKPGIEAVVEALQQPSGDRFLLVHLMDPHLAYRPPEPFQSRFIDPSYRGRFLKGQSARAIKDMWIFKRAPDEADKQHLLDLHEAAIAYADSEVGRVFDAAKAATDDLLFVVTSDHGEEFWEHGGFDHGHSLFDELLHVPLVAYRTGATPGRVKGTVDARKLVGTFLDFAGLERGGLEALPTSDGDGPVFGRPTLYGVRQRSVELDGWKYIVRQEHAGRVHERVRKDPTHLLFDLTTDPGEQSDRMAAEPARAADLHRLVVEDSMAAFPGAFFAWVGPGKEPVELTWTMEGAEGWHPDVTDFPWPAADGSTPKTAPLTVHRTAEGTTARVTLGVHHRPTLIVVEPRVDGGAVSVSVGGEAAVLDRVFEPTELLAMIDGGSEGVQLGRMAGSLRARAANDVASEDDVAALKALGYME